MPERFMLAYADQANDVLRAILDQSVDCIKLISLAGEIEYINPNGLRALSLADHEAIMARKWTELWPEEGRARVVLALDRARRGQQDRFEGYCPNFRGEPRWWDVSVSPILGSDGRQTHILATSRDITTQVQERLSERILREQAEQVAERSDHVAREMRHRLKNQLAVVSSVAKLLARHSTDAADLITRLEGKLQALARAQDLLTVNREQPVAAVQAIAQVLDASGAGERIEVGVVPRATLGDDAIQQLALILGELQTNSLKYGALGKGRGQILLTGSLHAKVLSLHWHEDTGEDVVPPGNEGSGFKLLARLGSVSGRNAQVQWHGSGPAIDFHVRVL